MKGIASLSITAAMLAGCAFPAMSAADTATIGSTLTAPHNVSVVAASAVQLGTATPQQMVIPANGLLGHWAVRSGDSGSIYELSVLHPVSGNALDQGFTVTSFVGSNAPVPDFSDAVRTYGGNGLILHQGDYIGLTGSGSLPFHQSGNAADAYAAYPTHWDQNVAYGPPAGTTGRELLLQATEQYCLVPDVHRLKLGVARRELASHDCQILVVQKRVGVKRKRKRVLRQSLAPGTTNVPNTPVQVVVGKLRRKKR